jgi:hypothetical protein
MKTTGMLFCASAIAALVGIGCGEAKTPATDDFSSMAGLDEKSDAFSSRMKLVGSLSYGQTSATVSYTKTPRYRAFKFGGKKGDNVTISVHSTNGGDSLAWLLDNSFRTIASNDDADSSTLDSKIVATLPGNTNPDIITYYIVFRDYWLSSAKFAVTLQGVPDYTSCQRDSDCVAVERGCCALNDLISVRADEADAYHASLQCPAHQICPEIVFYNDGSTPECNATTQKCEMVKPDDVACGGRTLNPHSCPDGWTCAGPGLAVDVPGKCYKTCGGIAGIACPDGLSCVDNPYDNCDPSAGGADCGGLCTKACVQNMACMRDHHFDRIACSCVPN